MDQSNISCASFSKYLILGQTPGNEHLYFIGYDPLLSKPYLFLMANCTNKDFSNTEFSKEASLLKDLKHPNIVKLHEILEKEAYKANNGKITDKMSLVFDLDYNGCLFDYISFTGAFSEILARTYFRQIIDVLDYLKDKGFAHRLIKPESFFLDEDYRMIFMDFSFAKYSKRKLYTFLGTLAYMAPELREQKSYDGPVIDLFAAGIVLFVMFSGTPPFANAMMSDPWYKFFNNKNQAFWNGQQKYKKTPNFFSEDFKDLINKMLGYEVENRIDLEKIKQHPWFNGEVLSAEEVKDEMLKRKKMLEEFQPLDKLKNLALKRVE